MEVVPVAVVGRACLVPVVDAEGPLARASVMVVRHRVRKAPCPNLIRRTFCIERRVQPLLLEEER
jgi:hypothetical protein